MALLGGLANLAIVTLIALGLGAVIRAPDQTFYPGLRGAVVATIVALAAYWVIGLLVPATPRWVFLIILAPLIEETARLWFAVRAKATLSDPRSWLFFALGYASIEALFEGIDAGFRIARGGDAAEELLPAFISFLLHIAIGMLASALLRMGCRQTRILAVTIGVHALHNWSVTEFYFPEFRILLFGLLIGGIFRWGERFAPVTNPPDRASTPP